MVGTTLALLALGACTRGPAAIEVEDQILITALAPTSPGARAVDKEGEPLPDVVVLASAVSNPEVLEMGRDGRVRCLKSGDVDLTLSAGGISRVVKVSCVLVKELRVNPRGLLGVLVPGPDGALHAESAPTLTVEVIDSEGKVNTAIPVDIRAVDPSIVTVDKDRVVQFLARGRTELRLLAGGQSLGMPVEVHQEVLRKVDLSIKPREGFGAPLEPGFYRVTAGSDQPIEVSFAGTECDTDKGTEIDLECKRDTTGMVQVENSPGFSFGKVANVKLRVVRLPDP